MVYDHKKPWAFPPVADVYTDPNSPYNQGFKFKMTVTSALDGFKMVTTTANGIKEVNVFKGNDAETHIEQLNYILKDLMDHNIIVEE